nr:hypothetical protein [Tanacetum cinerariifolium]
MKKDPETPLLVGRGFLATANAVIDFRMTKITIGEWITRLVFGVKGVDLGKGKALYWTTLGKRKSYKLRPISDGVGARTPYYARKDFLDFQSDEPTHSGTTIVEVPKELPKVSMVNSCLKKLQYHLASFDVVVKE